MYVLQVNDDFLIALAAKPSRIEILLISGCKFTADGLKYIRRVNLFIFYFY